MTGKRDRKLFEWTGNGTGRDRKAQERNGTGKGKMKKPLGTPLTTSVPTSGFLSGTGRVIYI
jgi:hypothetical protein